MESLFIRVRGRGAPRHTILESFAGDVIDQVADTARISPFIVIPRDYFDAIAGDYRVHGSFNDGRKGIATVITRDQFLCFEAKVSIQRSPYGRRRHSGLP